MLNSSFFKLLITLSNKEVVAFQQFALGTKTNRKIPNRFFSYIVTHGTSETAWKSISIEEAYLATFNQAYSSEKHRKKILNILSELETWLKSFLVWKEVEGSKILKQFVLLRVYFERGLVDRFNKLSAQSTKLTDTFPNGFWEPLFAMIFYHLSYFNSTVIDLQKATKLKAAMKYLEQFYLQARLRYVGELVNRNNLRDDNQDFLIPIDLLHSVGKVEHQDNYYLQLYYWIVQLSNHRTRQAYEKVTHYFHLVSFSDKEEEQEVLMHLLNFCSYAVRRGEFSYVQESLNVYKKAVTENRLDLYLTGPRFLNIVTVACVNKELDWADYFIERYSHKMIVSKEKDFVLLSKVRVLIARKQYEDVLISLSNIQSKLFHIEKTRRTFQLKCLVDLKENPALILNQCANFLLYLKRDKFSSKENKLSYSNYIKIIQKLQSKKSKQDIVNFMEGSSFIAYKSWVLEWVEKYK